MDKNLFENEILTDKDNYYLTSNDTKVLKKAEYEFDLSDIALYRMEEVSFEDQSPRKEALENVLSTMKIDGINFIYLLLGDENGVNFYYGISRNFVLGKEPELSIMDIGEKILEPSIKGNFRGSRTRKVENEERRKVLDEIYNMKEFSMLEGVPGYTKEDEKFQGVDRLADVMIGDKFGFMIIATPASYDDIKEIEKNLYDVYSRLVPLAKESVQSGTNSSKSVSEGTSDSVSSSVSENYSKSKQESVNISDGTNRNDTKTDGTNTSKGTNKNNSSGDGYSSSSNGTSTSGGESHSKAVATGVNHSESKTTGGSETNGTSKTNGTNKGKSTQKTNGEGISETKSHEFIDKKSQDWIKYLDDVILPRLDYGMGKGIFITTSFLFSDSKPVLKKLENTAISLYSGETGNKVPLRAFSVDRNSEIFKSLKCFQLPCGRINSKKNGEHENVSRSALSQYMKKDKSFVIGNWITTNELAMIAGLPQKEVVGLALREEVEFGLNHQVEITDENKILLGDLVQSGNVLKTSPIYLDKESLDKHIFVSGVTGSGKTTTCQNILCGCDLPFLVIEPAKTEYRIMKEQYSDLMVFTLGNENAGTPFRLNPFEFFPHESITSRVDMIKASIEAAFDMEAAIPQIIESAIYACYEDYGWNISKNENTRFEDPFADGVYAFPTLEDLINKVPEMVDEQGFDVRLKNDYIGSIKARLMGLLMGSKGMMLNTKRSIDFKELLERKVVLELEEIRNGSEKSLIMGFVLTNLLQAIKGKYIETGKAYNHITLVEEAHRLLSKYSPGDSMNMKQGVETFTDMLAEIRKYGECLVIVDQIPNKLTPEILKNTNTKIVHKLFASDDKDAIGNTIVLDKDQKEFLSNLETGRAIVFSQGYNKALQVQIRRMTETDAKIKIVDNDLRDSVYDYYIKNYKKGIIINTQFLDKEPTFEELQKILDISKEKELCEAVYEYGCMYKKLPSDDMLNNIKNAITDKRLEHVYSEISNAKSTKNDAVEIRKEEQIEILKEYMDMFDKEYLVYLLTAAHCRSKEIRKTDAWIEVKKELGSDAKKKKILAYINKYISDEEMSLEEVRRFRNIL